MVQAVDTEELKVFLDELDENLAFLDDAILNLEENPDDKETLEEIFRVAHTIKGSASFLGLKNLVELGHSMENVFMEFHKGGVEVTRDVIDTVLACKDAIEAIGHALGKGEDTDSIEVDHLVEKVHAFLENSEAQAKEEMSPAGLPPEIEPLDDCTVVRVWISPLEVAPSIRAFLVYKNLSDLGEICKQEPEESFLDSDEFQAQDEREVRYWFQGGVPKGEIENSLKIDLIDRVEILEDFEIVEHNQKVAKSDVPKAKPKGDEKKEKKKVEKKPTTSRDDVEVSDNVRIPVSRLDTLLNLVGELVITNSGFLNVQDEVRQVPGLDATFRNMRDRVKELFRISADIQELVMKSRLVPVGQVFHRFKRFVRDYSGKSDKMIQFQTVGDDTEIDKMIIDEMIKPLTHMVRNSLDHGIETVQDRLKAGKHEAGTLTLAASQEGNYINISISDDGKGINVAVIKDKAVKKGIISKEEAEKMPDDQARQLIFAQGFSTKEAVDEMSGRGVGMDVVKRSVEVLNGTILVDSTWGHGTKITIKLPLTLAILNALIVQVGKERFCIPMASIIETQKVHQSSFITVEGNEMVRLRNQLIPIVDLSQIFDQFITKEVEKVDEGEIIIEYEKEREDERLEEDDEFPVIVVEYNDNLVGFLVDQFISRQEMVIKSLAEHFRPIDGISGASILGDGTIILILDVHGVIQLYRAHRRQLGMQMAVSTTTPPAQKEDHLKLYSDRVQVKDVKVVDGLPQAIQLDEEEKKVEESSPKAKSKPATRATPAAQPTVSKKVESDDVVSDEDLAKAFPALAGDSGGYIVPDNVASPLSSETASPAVEQEPSQEKTEETAQAPAENSETEDEEDVTFFDKATKEPVSSANESQPAVKHSPEQLERLQRLFEPEHIDMLKDWLRQGNSRAIQGIQQLTGNINIRMGKSKAKRIVAEQISQLLTHIVEGRSGSIAFELPILPLDGVIFFMLTEKSAKQMIDMLWREMNLPAPEEGDEIDFEPLMEVTNIIGSSYTNSLAQVCDATIEPGVPALLEGDENIKLKIQNKLDSTSFKVLYIENQFLWDQEGIFAELLIMLPEINVLQST